MNRRRTIALMLLAGLGATASGRLRLVRVFEIIRVEGYSFLVNAIARRSPSIFADTALRPANARGSSTWRL